MKPGLGLRVMATLLPAFLAGVSQAQQQQPAGAPAPAASSNEVEFVALTEKARGLSQSSRSATNASLISVTLDDVALEDVVRMFTRISGANIIACASNLSGRVTVNLTDVEWKPALQSILDMHGLTLTEKTPGTEVYSIVPRAPDAPEPMGTRTLFLKFATVAEVSGLVSNMLAPRGTVTPFPSRNALIVRTTAENQIEIDKILTEVDRLREQVFIEAKFMELNDRAIKDLGLNWQVLEGYGLSAGGIKWTMQNKRDWVDGRTDAGSAWNNRRNLDTVNQLHDLYDVQYQNSEMSFVEDPAGGPSIPQVKLTPTRTVDDNVDLGREASTEIENKFTKAFTDVRTAVLAVDDFKLVLSALKQMDGVSIVSNPKIIVANEQPAIIHVGQRERPFVAVVTPASQNSAPFVTYNPGDPVDLGVKLTVTPTINTRSNISVRIQPELTRFVRNASAPNGQTYPIIATKKIETVFCLENGKTVAIGGLTETSDNDVTKKIPLLGDIPLVGKFLFSHTHKEKSQQETIIFVTLGLASPQTISPNEGIPEDSDLVHRRLLQRSPRKKEIQTQIEGLIRELDPKSPAGAGR